MTNEQRIFCLAFRIAESIYIKPGQPVKSQEEILAEFPEMEPKPQIARGQWSIVHSVSDGAFIKTGISEVGV